MSTITKYTDNQAAHRDLGGRAYRAEVLLDFAANPYSAADVIQVANIPANSLVTAVMTVVKVAEGATCTGTLGDTTTGADAWDASVNLNASAGTATRSLEATDTNAGAIFYTTAHTINLVLGHDTDAAKFIVVVEYTVLETYAVG